MKARLADGFGPLAGQFQQGGQQAGLRRITLEQRAEDHAHDVRDLAEEELKRSQRMTELSQKRMSAGLESSSVEGRSAGSPALIFASSSTPWAGTPRL